MPRRPPDTASILKRWRARLQITQAVAAERLGVGLRTYQNWESGRPFPYAIILDMALRGEEHVAVPVVRRP